MSLKNKFLSISTAAISIAAFSTFTVAQDAKAPTSETATDKAVQAEGRHGRGKHGMAGKGGHGKRHGMMGMLKGLNLTDAQREQMKAIKLANIPDQTTRDEVKTLRQAKQDGTITTAQQERLTTIKAQGMEKMKSVHTQIMGILTPEQKAQIEQNKADRKQRMQERRQKRQAAPAPATSLTN